MHDISLITTIALALSAALLFGLLARRLGLSPIVGYLIAGVLIGPYTPGVVGDAKIAAAARGDRRDPADVRRRPAFQFEGLARGSLARHSRRAGRKAPPRRSPASGWPWRSGWSWQTGLILGIAVSVASTVVLLRALMDHGGRRTRQRDTPRSAGWSWKTSSPCSSSSCCRAAAPGGGRVTCGKPWASRCEARHADCHRPARRRAVLPLAALAGGATALARAVHARRVGDGDLRGDGLICRVRRFDGAGRIPRRHGRRAIQSERSSRGRCSPDAQRLRSALLRRRSECSSITARCSTRRAAHRACSAIILLVKPLAAFVIVILSGHSLKTALTVAGGLAQIGEFSFIVGEMAKSLGLMPGSGHN